VTPPFRPRSRSWRQVMEEEVSAPSNVSAGGYSVKVPPAGPAQPWLEYEFLGELYRFYLDLMVKTVGAYFAIVGAIVTLVLANVKGQPIIAVALVVPIAMSLLLALAGLLIRSKVRELRDALEELGASLSVTVKPHVEILDWGVRGSSLLLLIASALLAALFLWLASRNGLLP